MSWTAPSSDGFTATPGGWQTAVYARCIIGAGAKPMWFGRGFDVFDVIEHIRECLAPSFGKRLSQAQLAALREQAPDFRPPSITIAAYLEWLANAGTLVPQGARYHVSTRELDELWQRQNCWQVTTARRRRVIERVTAIVERVPVDERGRFHLSAGWPRRCRAWVRAFKR